MSQTDRHQVVCDRCGRVGRYASKDMAEQMLDVHVTVHTEDEPGCAPPRTAVVSDVACDDGPRR